MDFFSCMDLILIRMIIQVYTCGEEKRCMENEGDGMRYQEVYNLAKQGYSYQQIADKMGITLKTVYKYVYICKQKTGKKVVRHSRNVRRKRLEVALINKYGSRKEAARKIGISYSALNDILSGKHMPRDFTMVLLADATGLEWREILSES